MNPFTTELSHYRKLSKSSQNLFLSFVSFAAIDPLIGIFSSAFIWKQSHSFPALVGYQGGLYLGIVLGFLLNIPLINRFSLVRLHAVFLGLRIFPLGLLFFISSPSVLALVGVGALAGVMGGVYWGNRILLSYELTKREERSYFVGLELTAVLVLSVIVPILVGWCLDLPFLSKDIAYRIVALCAGGVLLLGSLRALHIESHVYPPVKPLGVFWTKRWLKVRVLYALLYFFQSSLVLFPPILVLTFLGSEFTLGVIQSLASLGVALSVYLYGKRAHPATRLKRLATGVAAICFGAVALVSFSPLLGIGAYIIFSGLGAAYMNGVVNPLFFDIVEENVSRPGQSYRFIVDREVFMNLGRGALLVLLIILGSQGTAYLFSLPLICAATQLPVIYLVKSISRETEIMQKSRAHKILPMMR